MQTKIFAAVLGIMSLLGSTNLAFASQIPSGYVLVPADVFFGQNTAIATPTAPAEISVAKSSVRINDDIGYVGEKYSVATVTLRDAANKPAVGQTVNLISSRATDTVKALQTATNSNGEINFQIVAKEEGVSSLTALVGNQTILERPRVVFLAKAGGVGGSLLRADVLTPDTTTAATSSAKTTATTQTFVDQISADFPDTVKAETPTDLTITIEGANGQPDEGFAGTIEFESSDQLAVLPQNYTFVTLDRGTHTFANAVTFGTAGQQTVTISGGANVGSKEIAVSVAGDSAGVSTPVITSPADGALLHESVSVSGLAPVNTNLVVFVDGQFFQNAQSDQNGNFLSEISLTDGSHEITVGVLRGDNSVGAVSEAVNVTLDQVAPVLQSIAIEPGNRITIGTNFTVKVKSEPNLKSAIFRIGDSSIDLDEAVELGTYTGEFTAPKEGTYFAGVELEDAAGNLGEYSEATTILVVPAITIDSIATSPRDGRVDLKWDAPANSMQVNHYEIFYGTSEDSLNKKFTTSDNSTAWYVDKLNNDTQYFFQVVSLDAAGKQNGGSAVVNETPIAEKVAPVVSVQSCNSRIALSWENTDPKIKNYWLDYGVASGDYAESQILPDGARRGEWEARDLINGTQYFFALRGVDDFGETVVQFDEVSATPQSGAVCESSDPIQLFQRKDADGNTILFWNAVAGATSYRVHAGTMPNVYDLPTVEVQATSFQPLGLTANQDYYFAVSAVFPGSHQSANLSNVTKVEVGPAEIILIALLAGLGGAYFLRRRTKTAGRQF
ncbi:MAG: fibronectin type III domain-containing protein [Patescibacteria group bacterium]